MGGCQDQTASSEHFAYRTMDDIEHQGSVLPCQFPLKWHVGEIDAGFEVSRSTVRRAAQRAAQAWEDRATRPLFEHTSGEGIPIHLRFDGRQRKTRALMEQHQQLNDYQAGIEQKRQKLTQREQSFQQVWNHYQEERANLSQRIEAFNRRVGRLSSQGGVSPAQKKELDRQRRQLDSRQQELEERGRRLQRRQQRLQQERNQLNRRIARYNRASDRFSHSFSTNIQEAGQYVEQVKVQGDEIRGVSNRRIQVFLFADPAALSWVLAHELGHAMGLGHITQKGSIMSAAFSVLEVGSQHPRATSADQRLLAQACPELLSG